MMYKQAGRVDKHLFFFLFTLSHSECPCYIQFFNNNPVLVRSHLPNLTTACQRCLKIRWNRTQVLHRKLHATRLTPIDPWSSTPIKFPSSNQSAILPQQHRRRQDLHYAACVTQMLPSINVLGAIFHSEYTAAIFHTAINYGQLTEIAAPSRATRLIVKITPLTQKLNRSRNLLKLQRTQLRLHRILRIHFAL